MIDIQKLDIVNWPHPALTTKAEPIEAITESIADIAEQMIRLCRSYNGLGLAANQVGLPIQMFVGPAYREDVGIPKGELFVFINPEIVSRSPEIESMDEGCLSFPGVRGVVNRSRSIVMEATNLQGVKIKCSAGFLTARVWQHEIDHLNGININESMLKKQRKKNRMKIAALERAVMPEAQRLEQEEIQRIMKDPMRGKE